MTKVGNYCVALVEGHSGNGWYVWAIEYPEDGALFFGVDYDGAVQWAEEAENSGRVVRRIFAAELQGEST